MEEKSSFIRYQFYVYVLLCLCLFDFLFPHALHDFTNIFSMFIDESLEREIWWIFLEFEMKMNSFLYLCDFWVKF